MKVCVCAASALSESNEILTCSVWVQIWWLHTWNSAERGGEGGMLRERERERKKEGWRKLGLGLMKSSCRDYVWQLSHQVDGSCKSIYLHMDRFDIFQCISVWVFHVCGVYVSWSTDVCVCVCVWARVLFWTSTC